MKKKNVGYRKNERGGGMKDAGKRKGGGSKGEMKDVGKRKGGVWDRRNLVWRKEERRGVERRKEYLERSKGGGMKGEM